MKHSIVTPWSTAFALSILTAFVCYLPCVLLLSASTDFTRFSATLFSQLIANQFSSAGAITTGLMVGMAIAASTVRLPATGRLVQLMIRVLGAVLAQLSFIACVMILMSGGRKSGIHLAAGVGLWAFPFLFCANALRLWTVGRVLSPKTILRAIISILILFLIYLSLANIPDDRKGFRHFLISAMTNTALLTLIVGTAGDLHYRKALGRQSTAGVACVPPHPCH